MCRSNKTGGLTMAISRQNKLRALALGESLIHLGQSTYGAERWR